MGKRRPGGQVHLEAGLRFRVADRTLGERHRQPAIAAVVRRADFARRNRFQHGVDQPPFLERVTHRWFTDCESVHRQQVLASTQFIGRFTQQDYAVALRLEGGRGDM
jgi:hypothetical protein